MTDQEMEEYEDLAKHPFKILSMEDQPLLNHYVKTKEIIEKNNVNPAYSPEMMAIYKVLGKEYTEILRRMKSGSDPDFVSTRRFENLEAKVDSHRRWLDQLSQEIIKREAQLTRLEALVRNV